MISVIGRGRSRRCHYDDCCDGEGGMDLQHLFAIFTVGEAERSNVIRQSGRYVSEIKIINYSLSVVRSY